MFLPPIWFILFFGYFQFLFRISGSPSSPVLFFPFFSFFFYKRSEFSFFFLSLNDAPPSWLPSFYRVFFFRVSDFSFTSFFCLWIWLGKTNKKVFAFFVDFLGIIWFHRVRAVFYCCRWVPFVWFFIESHFQSRFVQFTAAFYWFFVPSTSVSRPFSFSVPRLPKKTNTQRFSRKKLGKRMEILLLLLFFSKKNEGWNEIQIKWITKTFPTLSGHFDGFWLALFILMARSRSLLCLRRFLFHLFLQTSLKPS